MHTSALVLLPADTKDFLAAGSSLLKRHRLNEDAPESPWHVDYWTVGNENIADAQTAIALGVSNDETLGRNVCFVARLPSDFAPGAVITPDGKWHGLLEHGYRPVDADTPANSKAQADWRREAAELLRAHFDCVAVEFDVHC